MTPLIIFATIALLSVVGLGAAVGYYANKAGKLAGLNTVMMADAKKHASDLYNVVWENNRLIDRYKKVLAAKKEDLKNARNDLDEFKIKLAEGKTEEALQVGESLGDWLTASHDDAELDELLALQVEPPARGGPDEGGDRPGGSPEDVPGGGAATTSDGAARPGS